MGLLGRLFRRPSAAAVVLRPGRGWTVKVVGESQYQDALAGSYRRLGGDGHDLKVTALLLPEEDNSHDPNAVRVEINGQTVGYLPRERAREYRGSVGAERTMCSAKIMGGFEMDDGSRASYGVRLNAKWPPVAQ